MHCQYGLVEIILCLVKRSLKPPSPPLPQPPLRRQVALRSPPSRLLSSPQPPEKPPRPLLGLRCFVSILRSTILRSLERLLAICPCGLLALSPLLQNNTTVAYSRFS